MPKSKLETVELVDIILDSIETFTLESNVNIEFLKPSFSTKLRADKNQNLRVFNNLIKNAIQSIPKDTEGRVHIDIKEYEEMLLVEVRDNGTGVPEAVQEKIFVPNFTTKSKGMGLGLAMVKNMIENHGGQIWFNTEIGKGTTFYLTFKR
jgi:signal transduction histidine kinase